MRGLPSILSLFCNEFKKFNKKGAQKLDFIYYMTFRFLCNLNSDVKRIKCCHLHHCYGCHLIMLSGNL